MSIGAASTLCLPVLGKRAGLRAVAPAPPPRPRGSCSASPARRRFHASQSRCRWQECPLKRGGALVLGQAAVGKRLVQLARREGRDALREVLNNRRPVAGFDGVHNPVQGRGATRSAKLPVLALVLKAPSLRLGEVVGIRNVLPVNGSIRLATMCRCLCWCRDARQKPPAPFPCQAIPRKPCAAATISARVGS